MANKNEYIIRIKADGSSGSGNSPVTDPSGSNATDEGSSEKSYWTKSAESAKTAAQKIVSVGTAAAVADKLISYEISSVSLRTGATEYEQKLSYAYSTIKSTALPLVMGAVTGGLPGALIGGLFSLAMQGITWAQNAQTISYNKQLENISMGMASMRAGVTGSRTTSS